MSQSPSAVEPAAGSSVSSSQEDASMMMEPPPTVELSTGPSASSSQKDPDPDRTHGILNRDLVEEIGKLPALFKKAKQEHEERIIKKTVSSSQEETSVMTEPPPAVEPAAGPSASSSQKELGPHEILDTDLIEEIKKHPVLFMNARREHEERIIKKKPWFEICKLLFKNWNSYSLRKKLDTVKDLQKRWMDLKEEFFLRQEENRPDSPVSKKTKSIFENMNFLLEPTGDAQDLEVGAVCTQFGLDSVAQDTPEGDVNIGIPTLMPPSGAFISQQQQQQLINLATSSTSSATLERKNANVHFSSFIASLLGDLDKEQNFGTWMDILRLIQEAGERGSCSKKHKLIYVPGIGAEPSLVSVPAEEATEEEPSESYPSSQERPRNADGQLIYPETDEEDVEV